MPLILSSRIRVVLSLLLLLISNVAFTQDNWLILPSFPGNAKTAFVGLEDSILFAGTNDGIWRTGNAGFSWQHSLTSGVIYSLHASHSGKILAGGEGKIYFSTNKGQDWDSVKVDTDYPISKIVETSTGEFFFITGLSSLEGYVGDGIFYNNGDFITWEPRNNGINNVPLYCEQVAVDRQGRIYLGLGDEYVSGAGGLFVSDDKGLNWRKINLEITDLGTIKTSNVYGISISPEDSVIFSISGVVANYAVSLNMIKHRDDLNNQSSWGLIFARPSGMWWLTAVLNTIHFSANGEWYSSISAALSMGGSYVSTDKGATWTKLNAGIGISLTNQYEAQSFYETSYGRVLMSQYLDERIYGINKSILEPVYVSGKILDDLGNPLMATVYTNLYQSYSNMEGNYSIKLPKNFSGSIRPQYGQHTFTPQTLEIENLEEDKADQNFIGTYTGTHAVWGFVNDVHGLPIANAEVRGFNEVLYTNENGIFIGQVPHRWSGEIEIIVADKEVRPAKKQIPPVTTSIYAYQFTARDIGTFIVEGEFLIQFTEPIVVELQGFPETVRMSEDKKFVAQLQSGWSGVITPVAEGFSFTPSSITITNIQEDFINILFVANEIENPVEYYLVSGSIKTNNQPLAGIHMSGFPENVITDSEGNFSIVLPADWQGVITPQASAYVFSPTSIPIGPLTSDVNDIQFTATLITDIDEEHRKAIGVYPNPSNGKFKLSIPTDLNPSLIEIVNCKGEKVKNSVSHDDYQIDDPGLYLIRITANDKVHVIKVLIQ